jgi:ribosomal-protein-alanine N-acetyltransferase
MTFKIVPGGMYDAATFASLHAAAFAEPWSPSAFFGTLSTLGAYGCIAVDGATPIGVVVGSAAGDEAEIVTLAVAPAARCRGVGRALMEAAQRSACERGARTMFLEVADDNLPAQSLYAALGFTQAGVRRGYYASGGGAPRDALVLSRRMDELG